MPQPPRGDARSPQLRLLPPGRPCKSRGGGKERGVPRGGSPATRRAPASASAARPGAAAASSPRCPRGLRRSGAGSVPRAPGLGQRQGPRGRRLPPALARAGAAPSSPVPPERGSRGRWVPDSRRALAAAEPSRPSVRLHGQGSPRSSAVAGAGIGPSGRTDGTREQSAPSGPGTSRCCQPAPPPFPEGSAGIGASRAGAGKPQPPLERGEGRAAASLRAVKVGLDARQPRQSCQALSLLAFPSLRPSLRGALLSRSPALPRVYATALRPRPRAPSRSPAAAAARRDGTGHSERPGPPSPTGTGPRTAANSGEGRGGRVTAGRLRPLLSCRAPGGSAATHWRLPGEGRRARPGSARLGPDGHSGFSPGPGPSRGSVADRS